MSGRAELLVLAVMLSAGCATYVPSGSEVSDVRIELTDLEHEEASIAAIRWDARLEVTNPNPFDLRIEFLEVGLEVGGSRLGRGSTRGFTVGKYDTKEVKVTVSTSSLGMAAAVMGVIQSKDFTYALSADVTYKTKEGPLPRHLEERGSLKR